MHAAEWLHGIFIRPACRVIGFKAMPPLPACAGRAARSLEKDDQHNTKGKQP